MRVLIVEDNRMHAEFLNSLITSAIEGVRVDWDFYDAKGEMGLDKILIVLLQEAYDIVIADLNLGINDQARPFEPFVKNGEDILRFAQQFQRPTTLLVACGGHIGDEWKARLEENFNGAYEAPGETENLIAYLKEMKK